MAPPMFAVNYAAGPTVKIIFDKDTGLNFAMVLHYTQEFEWFIPVKPGDKISNVAEITEIEPRENGSILKWVTLSINQKDEVVVKSSWAFFDRSAKVPGAGKPKYEKTGNDEILWTQDMEVRKGQTFIYAEPSGDHNPIHVDNDFAVKVGLPGIILQGLCTMAFAHKTCVDNLCGPQRDPLKLRKLGVQFSKNVLPGETITFQCYKKGDSPEGTNYGLVATNSENQHILRNSFCQII
ncbi:MaoC/PaaZ C-terminal domain-containing protein [Spirochaetota bacterium]